MSCRGVYWNNDHFGHFKDKVNIKEYEMLEEVKQEIKELKKAATCKIQTAAS
ncbi:hypothetical protein JTI58_12915 [Lysinibacillus fusiformis]|uniref:hypothetical protein n=1 Tax=Lysinibacillus fusiformis TaxID=28031 RepID=UPI0019671113|nr:hypothetical protein [Lysinibacillus fusiformis]QSB07951.1 hypothetical protein JTI58_12915 [Lysinibacillus fusiformis]